MSIHALISSFFSIFLKHEMFAVYLFMVACIRPVRGQCFAFAGIHDEGDRQNIKYVNNMDVSNI